MIRPARGYILVEQIDDALEAKGGFILPESSKDKPIKGVVLAVAEETFEYIKFKIDLLFKCYENHVRDLEHYPHESGVKEGDTIIFKKWGGQDIIEDGKDLKIVKFDEIMAVYREVKDSEPILSERYRKLLEALERQEEEKKKNE